MDDAVSWRHTVSDYKAWRKSYDGFAPVQKAGGREGRDRLSGRRDNPNDVTVTHDFRQCRRGAGPSSRTQN